MEKNNPSYRPLTKGEFGLVEAKYTLDKNFDLTGPNKIESPNDVAFLMKNIQKASVEHGFLVYVLPNDKPIVQHISMGSTTGTVIGFNAVEDAISRFKPKEIYFVHNHPSGRITPSNADMRIFEKLKDAHPDIYKGSLIINVTSGKYAFIDPYHILDEHNYLDKDSVKDIIHYKTLKFDKQVFKEDVVFNNITSSHDVAKIISGFKFSLGKKLGMLVLDRSNKVVGNIILPANILEKEAALEIKGYIARFNGSSVIMYGNQHEHNIANDKMRINIKHLKNELATSDFALLDFVMVNGKPDLNVDLNSVDLKYTSAADEGYMEDKVVYMTEAEKNIQWDQLAGATLHVEKVGSDFFAFGSEEACRNLAENIATTNEIHVGYSENLQSWYFVEYLDGIHVRDIVQEDKANYKLDRIFGHVKDGLSISVKDDSGNTLSKPLDKEDRINMHTYSLKQLRALVGKYFAEDPHVWKNNFPDVLNQTNGTSLKSNKYYEFAKNGGIMEAVRVVNDVIKPGLIESIGKYGKDAIIVPVMAHHDKGNNKLPFAYAFKIAATNEQWFEDRIVQTNVTKHTGATAVQRMFSTPEFSGPVEKNKNYILVDDFTTSGSTFKALKEYIETNGGHVVYTTALAVSSNPQTGYSGYLAVKPETIELLKDKFDVTELNKIISTYGIAKQIEGLTNSQANYILTYKTLDSFRDRIIEEGFQPSTRYMPGTDRESEKNIESVKGLSM